MTKKHFKAIADILADHLDDCDPSEDGVAMATAIRAVTEDLADYFRSVNSNFDRGRFLAAVTDPQRK